MRLDKLLEANGVGSRGQAKRLLQMGKVRVDGRILRQGKAIVDPGLQDIQVDSRQLRGPAESYLLLNKPAGLVTANRDGQHGTVFDCLAAQDRHPDLYAVGRLDRDTQGLLLLTTNGPLGFRLLHPKHHVTKTYAVTVNGPLGPDAEAFFAQGVVFDDGTVCQPAQLDILTSSSERSQAQLTIREGKFHQVKKMFLAYGVKVTSLTRTAFGDFVLDDQLAPGQYRRPTPAEKDILRTYLDGGRDKSREFSEN